MEKPKTIFVNFQDSHCIGHMGFWKTTAKDSSVPYLREDIAIKAMEVLMGKSIFPKLSKQNILDAFDEAFQSFENQN